MLAVATFAAVRSANQAARTAEHSLLTALRPLFVPSRIQDDVQKVHANYEIPDNEMAGLQ